MMFRSLLMNRKRSNGPAIVSPYSKAGLSLPGAPKRVGNGLKPFPTENSVWISDRLLFLSA
jgi:hypothetical protein